MTRDKSYKTREEVEDRLEFYRRMGIEVEILDSFITVSSTLGKVGEEYYPNVDSVKCYFKPSQVHEIYEGEKKVVVLKNRGLL